MPPPAAMPAAALDAAHATLLRGCGAFGRGAAAPGPLPEPIRRQRARFHGNGLRELDRFLSVLTDAGAACLAVAGHDTRAFGRLDNVANKLRHVRALMGGACADHELLRAIGRLRACLHHCSGEVHDAALWNDLAIIDVGGAADGATLNLTPAALDRICAVYRALGDEFVGDIRAHRG